MNKRDNNEFLRSLLKQDTITIAQKLLGVKLTMQIDDQIKSGYIVETECYLGAQDECSHSFNNHRTNKNEAMFHRAGTWYVYQIYGHNMINLVTCAENVPEAVLIRAIEPLDQQQDYIPNGPGKLTKWFEITRAMDQTTVFTDQLTISSGKTPRDISTSPRIGVKGSSEWIEQPLRFFVTGNPYVSKTAKKDQQLAEETWQIN